MFLRTLPSPSAIDRFLEESRRLTLSYEPQGIAISGQWRGRRDEQVVAIGSGPTDFERARAALASWRHFDLGWASVHPLAPGIRAGTVVAVLIRHLGFWSLNGCRVVYGVDEVAGGRRRFGFAYGTLTNHAECGEELFEVFLETGTGRVMYRIRVASRPNAVLARVGYPIVRRLQARFRRDSAAALRRAL
jgi:uncharacterized protein (UPF0548 family)